MHGLTSRKIEILRIVAWYYTVTRVQIQRILGVRSDRYMRSLLQELCMAGLLQKTRMQVVNLTAGSPAPVYFPSSKGAELLAGIIGEEWPLAACTRTPDWQHLFHWVAVAEFHITLDAAVRDNPAVRLLGWHGEWDEIDPGARAPEKRFRIYTLLQERPRLVCAPDAAFALAAGAEFSKTYYVEVDRGTSGIRQIASSKTPGYFTLRQSGRFRRHFETTADSFSVLHVSPTPSRRDALRKAFATRPGSDLHYFTAWEDWTAEKALTEPIFFGARLDTPQALIRFPSEVAA